MLNVYKIEVKNNQYHLDKIGTLSENLQFKPNLNSNFKLFNVDYEKHELHPHLRDSAPDNWGRRVLTQLYQLNHNVSDYIYLKLSNFDRTGNLFFFG